jgi:hypothetical protein
VAQERLERSVLVKRVVGRRIILGHILRDFEQLNGAALSAFQIGKRLAQPEKHFTSSMEAVAVGVATDFTGVFHKSRC